MTKLAGQTVLVTGANRGMGREYVAQLLDRGAAKVYAAARDPRKVDATDPRVVPLQLDVTDAAAIARAAETAYDVSVLVNNAGIALADSVLNPDPASLRRELETNLFGPLALTAAFADRLVERTGAVVNVASVVSWIGLSGTYGVSKAALWSATDSMCMSSRPAASRSSVSTSATSTPTWQRPWTTQVRSRRRGAGRARRR